MTDEELEDPETGLAHRGERSARSWAKTDEALQDLARAQERTDKLLGELGNCFGDFRERMALFSIREILLDQLGVDAVFADTSARRNGRSFQVDAVGLTHGETGKVYLVEIRSRLREEGLQQILEDLKVFGDFFPVYRDRTRYGILVAVDVPDALEERVLAQGIYLAKGHGDLFELVQPGGFKPRDFPGGSSVSGR